jgi:hypothetical protein
MAKPTTSTESIAETLAFPFRAEGATNRLLAGSGLLLLSFIIPIFPALVVYGYLLRVMRDVIGGKPASLPAWTDWGRLFVDGLKSFIVGFVYMLPATAVTAIGFGCYCSAIFYSVLVSVNAGPNAAEPTALPAWMFLAMGIYFLSFSVGLALALLGGLPLPMAQASLSERSSLGSGFALGHILRVMRANPGGTIVAWLIMGGIWMFSSLILMLAYYTLVLACLIPLLMVPVMFYALLVGAALFGDAYRVGIAKLEGAGA